jgi:hypothetical protein
MGVKPNPFIGNLGAGNISHPPTSPGTSNVPAQNPFSSVFGGTANKEPAIVPKESIQSSSTNPYSSVFSSAAGTSTPQFSVTTASVNGHVFTPISQNVANNYTGTTFKTESDEACLATVYTMVERGVDPIGKYTQINNNYNPSVGAVLPENLTRGPINNNLMSLQYGPQLVVINGTAETTSGNRVPHYMLGTYVNNDDGTKVIIANDPWTGTQVTVNAQTGRLVDPSAAAAGIEFQANAFRTLSVN